MIQTLLQVSAEVAQLLLVAADVSPPWERLLVAIIKDMVREGVFRPQAAAANAEFAASLKFINDARAFGAPCFFLLCRAKCPSMGG